MVTVVTVTILRTNCRQRLNVRPKNNASSTCAKLRKRKNIKDIRKTRITMKQIPNILSASRIALCLPLLMVDVMTVPFWVLYVIVGTTDILDGYLARRWGVESKFGARLDSLADFVFVLAVGYKLFPWLKLPAVLWMMIGLIALVKIVNAVSAYRVKHKMVFLHTKANKLTGFLLFVGMMAIGQSYFVLVAWVVACIALFAAIQEGHIIRSR